MAKPSQAATVEKFVAQHPELNALSQAQCREAERAAVALLDREDAGDLLLTPDEVAPWLPELSRRLLAAPKFMASVASGKPPNPKLTQAFFELLYQLGREMATTIFMPPRRQQLAEEILAYRRRLDPAQQQELLPGVHGALTAAHSDAAPAENHFLVSLCCKSLMLEIREMETEASAEGQTP